VRGRVIGLAAGGDETTAISSKAMTAGALQDCRKNGFKPC
jgi:hypothetical protein